MGTVYKALHVNLKQLVAVKTIRIAQGEVAQAALIDRFRREMEAVGTIQHPHVIRATDGGEEGGFYFLVMEFVDGVDLGQLSQELGPLPPADACELIRQAALGLSCINECGLIHRDIKPSNLMLSRDCVVKIADLGLARFGTQVNERSELTPEGCILGTPDYMAPEQARRSRSADTRSDIYSLGCTLYRLLTGQPPYPSPRFGTYVEKLIAHQQEPIPRFEGVRAIDDALQRMLAKAPPARFSLPEEVARVLEPLASGNDLPQIWKRLANRANALTEYPSAGRGGEALETPDPHAIQSEKETSQRQRATPERRSSKTPLAPHGSGARLAGVVLILMLVVTGIVIVASLGSFDSSSSRGPTSTGQTISEANPGDLKQSVLAGSPLDQLPARLEQDLLVQPPTELCWPDDAQFTWRYEPATGHLLFHGNGKGLLQLGETHSRHYTLRLKFRQKEWKGGIGVFLGGRLPREEGEEGRAQFLELRQAKRRNVLGFNVTRGYYVLRQKAQGELTMVQASDVGSHRLASPDGELLMDITVVDGSLAEVRAGDTSLTDLFHENVRPMFTRLDQEGLFGITCQDDGVCTLARFLRYDQAP